MKLFGCSVSAAHRSLLVADQQDDQSSQTRNATTVRGVLYGNRACFPRNQTQREILSLLHVHVCVCAYSIDSRCLQATTAGLQPSQNPIVRLSAARASYW